MQTHRRIIFAAAFAWALCGFPPASWAADAPNLALMSSLVHGGGDAEHFSSAALLQYLADARAGAEMRSLQREAGNTAVASFTTVFDFAIQDALRREAASGATLPAPGPAESGATLSEKLAQAGTANGAFSANFFLDNLFGNAMHAAIAHDIDTKFGAPADANFTALLAELMNDLSRMYS